jgi:hypothetical protein
MKKISPMLFVLLLNLCFFGCNQNHEKKENQNPPPTFKTSAKLVEGGWHLIWANYNDTLMDTSNYFLFKTFSNGIFSLFSYDSTKKINFAGYGKYEFDGDKLHETFIYHTDYVRAENWQNLEVRGDTMYMNGFKKVIIDGKEVMTDFSKIKEKLVKVKW